jgi:hypothetical protein
MTLSLNLKNRKHMHRGFLKVTTVIATPLNVRFRNLSVSLSKNYFKAAQTLNQPYLFAFVMAGNNNSGVSIV